MNAWISNIFYFYYLNEYLTVNLNFKNLNPGPHGGKASAKPTELKHN